QTPLIAAAAVALLHRAGVPAAALQLLPGRGETIGAALVADARIAGILFTGSTEVARSINRVLAQRQDDPVKRMPAMRASATSAAPIVSPCSRGRWRSS